MDSNKRTLLKTVSWETFHLVGVAGVIYLFTGEWEYASLGALIYIGWEALGYYLHERVWSRFGNKIKQCFQISVKQKVAQIKQQEQPILPQK